MKADQGAGRGEVAGSQTQGTEHPTLNQRCQARNACGAIAAILMVALLPGCRPEGTPMDASRLKEFATKYTAAWCSHHASSVAAFFAETGSLKINEAAPAVGRAAIVDAAQGFMTAFPDLVVAMDSISGQGDRAVYRWTLTGKNTGPGGTGRAVRISGYEEWALGSNGLIAKSTGHFDAADYQRQLQAGSTGR